MSDVLGLVDGWKAALVSTLLSVAVRAGFSR